MHIQKDMTIYTAAELKPLILGSLKESATQQIDLSGVAEIDRKSTRLNSSHIPLSRMPSSA